MFVDSHAHLTCDGVHSHIREVLQRARDVGVESIINICTDEETLKRGCKLKSEFPSIYNVGATTPHDVEKEGESMFSVFADAARKKKLVAVGETGLDYYYNHSDRELQKSFLRRYFALAKETGLPVVIHCRDAFDDLFRIADEAFNSSQVLLHCFTGTEENMQEAIRRGWMVSISGIVTFKKSEVLRAVVKVLPLEHLLIETDTPYLSPLSKRGKPNEPSFIVETAAMVGEIKGRGIQEIAACTTQNANRFFALPKKRIDL